MWGCCWRHKFRLQCESSVGLVEWVVRMSCIPGNSFSLHLQHPNQKSLMMCSCSLVKPSLFQIKSGAFPLTQSLLWLSPKLFEKGLSTAKLSGPILTFCNLNYKRTVKTKHHISWREYMKPTHLDHWYDVAPASAQGRNTLHFLRFKGEVKHLDHKRWDKHVISQLLL